MKYGFLIVGSGLYGATIVQQLHEARKTVLVVDKRPHIAEMFTQSGSKASTSKNTARTFSIQTTKPCGIT